MCQINHCINMPICGYNNQPDRTSHSVSSGIRWNEGSFIMYMSKKTDPTHVIWTQA